MFREPKNQATIDAQNAALVTVSKIFYLVMRDPASRDTTGNLSKMVAKLSTAKLELDEIRLAGPDDLKLSGLYSYERLVKGYQERSRKAEDEIDKIKDEYHGLRKEYEESKRKLKVSDAKRMQLRERVKELESGLSHKPAQTVEALRETILRSILPVYRTIRDLMERMNTQVDSREVLKELNVMKAEGLVEVSSAHSHWRLKRKEAGYEGTRHGHQCNAGGL